MTRDEFNTFCARLPETNHVVQWGNADVWKVDTKVFAICGWHENDAAFTFKVSDIAWEVLQDQPGIRPAPYLASRGMKWLQHYAAPGLSDTALSEHLMLSYLLVSENLTRKRRNALGLPDTLEALRQAMTQD
ncbi:MmcQ/YjbR family DNA-binding protein [Roseovarius pelagicus]|uniref:MmcQ/YjbR family DNA-binding protein n=1 Tax=Roseovarius pelagicus TaxID=2980108 RepID=A0ABY6DCY0_9RHOB|nr:MmcQ/YjbR family DNA-binding protein [Roseovarius pelagicus]UXX84011.1 MmcQ/YjbR family DNA-binding protein [Roseovarius pelagicus]